MELYPYCEKHSKQHSDLLQKLERETHLKTTSPQMISGQLQGRFLSFLSHLMRPRYILEIGTFTGYSALSLAEGLPENGKIITIEANEEMELMARRFFDESEWTSQIEMIIGNAEEVIPSLEHEFDLVFIDAKKIDYSLYYDLIIDKVKSGGVILADNVIWYENILDKKLLKDKKTASLHAFNEKLLADERIDNFILPLRDGLNIARKK
jgi:caffeoyl-CoA O-methyltransferase